ncbi:MAG: aminotransferase class I/II-fold pyridoxal phosphate-dependent enzyme [Myxococcota bacterium]
MSVDRQFGSSAGSLDGYLEQQLERLRTEGLFRDPNDAGARRVVLGRGGDGAEGLDATSNDYLGLAAQRVSVSRETVDAGRLSTDWVPSGPGCRAGAGASRLVQGTWPEHEELERALASWVGLPAALLFNSGFAANSGTVAALADADSVVLSDQFNHASIVDGCRLSRAQVAVIPHLNLAALETALVRSAAFRVRWVVTESYFSMDGDGADLSVLRALCDRHRAFLVVDEAHALGVFGPRGAGRCAEAKVKPDVLVGTLGKAIGTEGAFVAGSEALRTWLWNRARSFVFSTAPSPATCALTLSHVKQVVASEAARSAVLENAKRLRQHLEDAGISLVPGSFGPIVSIVVGTNDAALGLADQLRGEGILVQPIRPPTVPEGFARIRVTVSARLSGGDVDRLARALVRGWKQTCGGSS